MVPRSIATGRAFSTVREMTTPLDPGQETLTELAAAALLTADALERVGALGALGRAAEIALRASVASARDEGQSWAAIAERLGVSKQAAAQRFGPPRRRRAAAAESGSSAHSSANGSAALPAARRATAAREGWDVRTRGGRTLLRIMPRR